MQVPRLSIPIFAFTFTFVILCQIRSDQVSHVHVTLGLSSIFLGFGTITMSFTFSDSRLGRYVVLGGLG